MGQFQHIALVARRQYFNFLLLINHAEQLSVKTVQLQVLQHFLLGFHFVQPLQEQLQEQFFRFEAFLESYILSLTIERQAFVAVVLL